MFSTLLAFEVVTNAQSRVLFTMIPLNIIQETERRFAIRTPQRTETEEKLRSGSKLLVDEPQRVEKRIKRLLRGGFVPAMAELGAPPTSGVSATVGTEPLGLERILNKNNLMSINYLERGLTVSRSVARIRIRAAQGQTLGFGTGFMVSLSITDDQQPCTLRCSRYFV